MPIYRVQVRIPWDTALPQDVSVNVWHFDAGGVPDVVNAIGALKTFYQSIDDRLSSLLDDTTDAVIVKAYDLSDPIPRAPVHEETWTLADMDSSTLPSEVAVCLSFQAEQTSGVPQARRRGRIFFGPVHTGVNSAGRVDAAAITDFTTAAGVLLAASVAAAAWDWVVYSPTDDAAYVVDNGWMDNEFDTIRARGLAANSRTTF